MPSHFCVLIKTVITGSSDLFYPSSLLSASVLLAAVIALINNSPPSWKASLNKKIDGNLHKVGEKCPKEV